MRVILFRGKRTDNGEWIYGHLAACDMICPEYPEDTSNATGTYYGKIPYVGFVIVDPTTVGQYTGLKDANGKPIFEGDVVGELHYRYGEPDRNNGYNKVFQVSMDDDRRGWYPFACGDGCGCCETDTIWPDGCDVIGNIHDNPELLEVHHA